MLRAGKSKSSGNLSRRKSASSVTAKQDSIDSETARQHALAAAMYAFSRAQERDEADLGNEPRPSRKSFTTKKEYQPRLSLSDEAARPEDHGLRRQQSVRFAGPEAVQKRRMIGSRTSQNPITLKVSDAGLRPRARTIDTPVPATYRPPTRSSSIGRSTLYGGDATCDAAFLTAYPEYYTKEDGIASTPSSYRRVRTSKSMLSDLRTSSVFFHNGTPDSRASALADKPRYLMLRAPKSVPFLRANRDLARSNRHQEPDTAVQEARDRFLHDLEQQRLREQPSFIFRSRFGRQDKPFHKYIRSSGFNPYGSPIASPNQNVYRAKESRLRCEARKVSQMIKTRFKDLFRPTHQAGGTAIPDQQVEAHVCHANQLSGEMMGIDPSGLSDLTLPDNARKVAHVSSPVNGIAYSESVYSRTTSGRTAATASSSTLGGDFEIKAAY
ncbi:MAG: hypothetical protein M1818_007720 [Claussenomyces sp. TS43310]|nr:MAG: hypothetical protein M1818_007720 [Claussenomyces sp. TS43310]